MTQRAFGLETITFDEEKSLLLWLCSGLEFLFDAPSFSAQELAETLQRASPEAHNDPEIALAYATRDVSLLEHFGESVRGDRAFALAAVSESKGALQYVSRGLQGDKEVVLAAVTIHGSSLQYACEELRGDKEVVLAAVREDGCALTHATEELRGEKEVVLAAVSMAGEVLRYANQELRGDKEVVLAAVSMAGKALRYASQELRGDKEVVLAAVSQNNFALEYANEELHRDKDFLLLASRQISGIHDREQFYYDEAAPGLKAVLPTDEFCLASESSLGVSGQPTPAPMLTVTLTRVAMESRQSDYFHAEVTLSLSGESFACDLPPSTRPLGPVLDDLAKELVVKLHEIGKGGQHDHVFITFIKNDDGDVVVASPWDCYRPLRYFLKS